MPENNNNLEIIDLRECHFRVSNHIFDFQLSVYELGIYFCLCRYANNKNTESFPSITKLEKMINISRPKVINSLKKLVNLKIIYKRKGFTGKSNRYYLLDLPSIRQILVNDINQGSKPHLPGSKPHLPEVVNEVYPKKTHLKKTHLKKTNEKDSCEIPSSLLTINEFKSTWENWLTYRKEIKKKVVLSTARQQLEMLARQPDPVAVINQSIEKGWQGLFEIKNDKKFDDKQDINKQDIKKQSLKNQEILLKQIKDGKL